MDCSIKQRKMNFVKVLLVVLNGFCIMLAIDAIVFALVDTQILKQYGEEKAAGTFIGDVIIMTACLFLVAVASFGTVGAIKENAKVLYMYIGLLMILVMLEVFIAVYVSVQRFGLQFKVSEWIREDFFQNITGDNLEQQKLWDKLQITYECCGLNGPEDYQAMLKPISLSCCPRAYRARTWFAQQQLYNACIESASYYSLGCEKEIQFVLRSDAIWLMSVALTIFGFEGAGMLLAMYVANKSKTASAFYQVPLRF